MKKDNTRRGALKKLTTGAVLSFIPAALLSRSRPEGKVDIYFIIVPYGWEDIGHVNDALRERFDPEEIKFVFIFMQGIVRPEILRVRDFEAGQVEPLAKELAKYILKPK